MSDPKAYWANRGVLKFYRDDQPYRGWMADRVLAESPRRVLEFGCNVGRNLYAIHAKAPTIGLVGVDVNAKAVAHGRRWGLDLRVGDERWLGTQPDDSFDVAFTVSVLDHMPDPTYAIEQLARIAPTLLLLEPWSGEEQDVSALALTAGQFTYSWDLTPRLRTLGYRVATKAHRLEGGGLADIYRLVTARRDVRMAEASIEVIHDALDGSGLDVTHHGPTVADAAPEDAPPDA